MHCLLGTLQSIVYMLSHCILSFFGSNESKHESEVWGLLSLEWPCWRVRCSVDCGACPTGAAGVAGMALGVGGESMGKADRSLSTHTVQPGMSLSERSGEYWLI